MNEKQSIITMDGQGNIALPTVQQVGVLAAGIPQVPKPAPEIPLKQDFPDNGGHLSINQQRWEKSRKSKNETAKFNKEYAMVEVLARKRTQD